MNKRLCKDCMIWIGYSKPGVERCKSCQKKRIIEKIKKYNKTRKYKRYQKNYRTINKDKIAMYFKEYSRRKKDAKTETMGKQEVCRTT
jgi:hypothetical protein